MKSLCFVCEPKGLCVSVWEVAGEQCVCVCVCVCVVCVGCGVPAGTFMCGVKSLYVCLCVCVCGCVCVCVCMCVCVCVCVCVVGLSSGWWHGETC